MLVVLRLPYLNRPLSKHHEFNTAVILINAESWQQAGGGKQFCFTPLLNYQGASNHLLDKGWHIDKKGNHVYLSFGAGWYVLPYLFFKTLHLPFTPLWLQLLNITIGVITAILLWYLLVTVTGQHKIAFAGTAIFMLLPAPLWYMGTGYVTTAIMLPVVIGILYTWNAIEKNIACVNSKYLSVLFLLGIILCYIDWLAVFLLLVMAAWALLKARTRLTYIWVTVIAMLSMLTGTGIVLMQFAGYLGWQQVLHYWQSRFADRSTGTSEYSAGIMLWMVVKNLATGYLPLILLMLYALKVKLRSRFQPIISWPLWALVAIIPYNGMFFNWSAQHEFAWMAFALFSIVAISIYLLPYLKTVSLKKITGIIIFLSLLQYFIINLPGTVSIKGDPYDQQAKLGKWIQKNVDSSLPVFTNISNDKIVEYYSKRTFNTAQTPAEAIALAGVYGISAAVWIKINNGKVERITKLFPPQTPK